MLKLLNYYFMIDFSVTCEDDDMIDMHKIYITVTTLPSLSNCKDCKSVAYEHRHEGKIVYYLISNIIIRFV